MKTPIVLAFAMVAALTVSAVAETVDPTNILFSTPTITNQIAAIEPNSTPPSAADYVLSEDDWRQLEFFPKSRLAEIKLALTELKAFEAANRSGSGWKNVYVRKIDGAPLIDGKGAIAHLEKTMRAKFGPAPVVTSAEGAGRVKEGFTLPLNGDNPTLYGVLAKGVPVVLASHPRSQPEQHRMLIAFYELNKSDGLLLVDWVGQTILVSVAADGEIEKWKP